MKNDILNTCCFFYVFGAVTPLAFVTNSSGLTLVALSFTIIMAIVCVNRIGNVFRQIK